jgi:integrase
VANKGATKRVRKARSLTAEQFSALLSELHEPFATMALLCVCLGLRISEALSIRWSDVDWLGSRLSIKRGIVEQRVDDCKTEGSAKALVLAEGLLARLKAWKQASQFRDAEDWVFASPHSIGRLPYSYGGTRDELSRAAKASGIRPVSTHAFRHYAESEIMPSRDSETLWKQLESCADSVVILGSMRHSPVSFAGHGGSSALDIRSLTSSPFLW